ncbi:MAG: low-specificity L-threonine aldolase [Ignavibacteriae bacterium]|nr:MAG: low-specificity L-threonine aldolase [Ignavibacteriota bacterium]
MIDLRSDTVTKPSKGMREAMANAEVGDDVYGEDPTVNELQRRCAEITGKEAALYVPSGCMANQLAIKSQTSPADEVILESESHILNYETAAPAFLSQVQLFPVQGVNGVFTADDIQKQIRPRAYYFPKTALICIENTHNRAGGTIFPIDEIKKIRELALKEGIRMHMDGARVFNASVETGIPVKEYASYVDSISFCFSKGLGAPVGSILCSDKETITKAHKYRKIIGGGMRQAGILAAAALYALDNNVQRLKEDHEKAKCFANEISKLKDISVDMSTVQTNIIIFRLNRTDEEINKFKSALKDKGILISDGSYGSLRAICHLDVSMDDVKKAIDAVKEVLS